VGIETYKGQQYAPFIIFSEIKFYIKA